MGKGLTEIRSSQRKHEPNGKTDTLMQTSLRAIANKATKSKKYRFRNLYTMFNRENLEDSWRYLNRRAAPGVDRETVESYGQNLTENIGNLVERLKQKRYRAKLVMRVLIPKGGGKMRALGLPALEDKLVQITAARILGAIYEQDFLSSSFGYRPGVGPHDAVRELTRTLNFGRFECVVEADIKGFFDHINHDWLIKMLGQRIDDRAFLRLIRKWLKAGILEKTGEVVHPVTGTPQGGVISPVLANIYLHYVLDLWFEKVVKRHVWGPAYLCRYADDFVCAFTDQEDAERFFRALSQRMQKFGLKLAPDKTRLFQFRRYDPTSSRFDFLSFEFRWGISQKGKWLIKRRTSRAKLRASIRSMRDWIRKNRSIRMRRLIPALNAKLRGYYNYYGVIGNYESICSFHWQVENLLHKWLNRRSQRRSYDWPGLVQMLKHHGLERPRIRERPVKQLRFEYC